MYDRFDYQIPVDENGDAMGRYRVRMAEMAESLKIIEQAVNRMPEGEYIVKKAPKPQWKPPKGEVYFAVEGARGKIGVYLISTGDEHLSRQTALAGIQRPEPFLGVGQRAPSAGCGFHPGKSGSGDSRD